MTPPARHALLVLAHDNERQLRRALGALRHERLSAFVHVDRASALRGSAPALGRLDGVESAVADHDVVWGGFAMLRATLDLLGRARPGGYQTYTLLSGSDYPVRPLERVVRALDGVDRPLLTFYDTGGDPAWHHRYQRPFFNDARPPVRRALNALSRRLLGRVRARRMPGGLTAHFGWQWWTLPARSADLVLDLVRRRPDVLRFMRHVDIPDEMFFHTVLGSLDTAVDLGGSALRYVDWSARGRHPKLLGPEDVPLAVNSGALFARKFDERRTPGVLDAVDRLRHGSTAP